MMSNGHPMSYALRPMREEDIPQVAQIDRDAFPENVVTPAFRRELHNNKLAHYLVAWETETTYAEWAPGAGLPPPSQNGTSEKRGRFSTAMRRLLKGDQPQLPETEELLVGYLGMWAVIDEGHVISIGVRSSHRNKGIGELLILGAVELCMLIDSRQVTLEVRVSNEVAQNLYKKYGFKIVGRRKRYYSDNGEDAYVMTTDPIDTPDYQGLLADLRTQHSERWGVSARYFGDDED